ncbi:hypothetical protein PROVALCAL_03359 [Providencia alcalifaciens DSM 30120]|uniref:Uncharacterized protein n=1 Tax=Providencia alcalifaciens DSM 30120 TaxID=520999 RepID=B6XJ10_9GAMM|nr:hypothetical protein PROVALCAL_03359 [Providencia alcalifaciens DSM 30120]
MAFFVSNIDYFNKNILNGNVFIMFSVLIINKIVNLHHMLHKELTLK